jgi:hypothetical protein
MTDATLMNMAELTTRAALAALERAAEESDIAATDAILDLLRAIDALRLALH